MSTNLIRAIRNFDHSALIQNLTYSSLNQPNSEKRSPLMISLMVKNEKAFKTLIKYNPIVYNDIYNNSVLHYAILNSSDIFSYMLNRYGSLIETVNLNLEQPIHSLVRNFTNKNQIVNLDILLQAYPNVNIHYFNIYDHNSLDISYMYENLQVFGKLLSYGGNVNIVDSNGKKLSQRHNFTNSLTPLIKVFEQDIIYRDSSSDEFIL